MERVSGVMLLEGGRQKRDKEADRGRIGEKVGYERSVLFLKSDCREGSGLFCVSSQSNIIPSRQTTWRQISG